MIKIRLQRFGSKHSPFYRMVVAPSTTKRDGRFIEILGTYDPQNRKRDAELKLNLERIDYWLGVGAQPSPTAKSLIRNGRLSTDDYSALMDKKSDAKAEARKKRAAAGAAPSVDASEASDEDATEGESPAEEVTEESEPEAPAEESEPETVAEEPSEKASEEESSEEESSEEESTEEPATEEEESSDDDSPEDEEQAEAESNSEEDDEDKRKEEGN